MEQKTLLALTFIRSIVLSLPGVNEKLCFDTPAFYVNKYIFARLKKMVRIWRSIRRKGKNGC
jgi:hypothetical protein